MKAFSKLSGYMPALDGWRAISIFLVVLHHTKVSVPIPVIGPLLARLSDFGGAGVWIFFAISGLLICGRLLQEEQKHGRISLRNFYIRRAFRILPPAMLYLATLAALSRWLHVTKLELFSSLFFFRNYALAALPPAYWFTGHFWSLAIEEHFYLLLPGILVFFPKRRARVLGALALVIAAWRFWLQHFTNVDVGYRTDTSLDALLIPALLAIAASSDRCAPFLRALLLPRFLVVFVAMWVFFLQFRLPVNLAILPLVLLGTSQHPENFIGKFLEWAPLRWVGRLSYSLYLWQQLFFCDRWWHGDLPLGVLQQWPLKLAGLFACACVSYYLLERPMMRLGHRIASSGVPGRGVDEASGPEPSRAKQFP
jgi:peptidoglycan/LPS O-acetylase OafA/YrhL